MKNVPKWLKDHIDNVLTADLEKEVLEMRCCYETPKENKGWLGYTNGDETIQIDGDLNADELRELAAMLDANKL